MIKSLLVSSVAVIGVSVTAVAADFPNRFPAPAPYAAPSYFLWTGAYAGVHAGGVWQEGNIKRGVFGDAFGTLTDQDWVILDGVSNGIASAIFPRSVSQERSGFTGGAQLGYNHQYGMWVVGGEIDLSYLGGDRRSHTVANNFVDPGLFIPGATASTNLTLRSQLDWLATARLRTGVVVDRFMIYATGGAAFGKPDHRVDFTATGSDGVTTISARFSGREDDIKVGWAVGGGVEYAVTNNMTIRGEYLYYNLGRTDVRATTTDFGGAFGTYGTYRFDNEGHIARAALNWKW